jgi:hypothetical protein
LARSTTRLAPLALLATGCAGRQLSEPDEHFEDPAPGDSPEIVCEAPDFETDDPKLLDTTQIRIEQFVYGTSRWFDGLFGESDVECAGNVSRGMVSTGLRFDERDGAKFRARFRASVALPAINRRANLIVGRGDVDRFVEGTDDENIQTLPERFNSFDEDEFLVGLGYSRNVGLRKGWDFGVGVKLGIPLDPYAKARYHLNPVVNELMLWRLTPQVFWQESRGAGVSLSSTVDVAMAEDWMLRNSITMVEDEESEGMEWSTKLTGFHNLDELSAYAFSVFASGETDAEVPLLDYGFELRYRRRILREWFFIELLGSLSYPREFLIEERERNLGVSVTFELQFGEWPNRD